MHIYIYIILQINFTHDLNIKIDFCYFLLLNNKQQTTNNMATISFEKPQTHPAQLDMTKLYEDGGLLTLEVVSQEVPHPDPNTLIVEGGGERRVRVSFEDDELGMPRLHLLSPDDDEPEFEETDTGDKCVPDDDSGFMPGEFNVRDTGSHRVNFTLPEGTFAISLRVRMPGDEGPQDRQNSAVVPLQSLPPTDNTEGRVQTIMHTNEGTVADYEIGAQDPDDLTKVLVTIDVHFVVAGIDNLATIGTPNLGEYSVPDFSTLLDTNASWAAPWMMYDRRLGFTDDESQHSGWHRLMSKAAKYDVSPMHRFGEPVPVMITGHDVELNPTVPNDVWSHPQVNAESQHLA